MRILGHIHTFNDEEVIDRSLQALLDQTYPLEEILLVDNASTDGTLNKSFPNQVTVIRHPDNRGTSGAVITGFKYAIEKGYDWIWIFDADSAPRKDALQKLVELYHSFSLDIRKEIWWVAGLTVDLATQTSNHGGVFTSRGLKQIRPDPGELFYQCDATVWSGSLYKLTLVRKVGHPSGDYALDWGEFEYGYRGKLCGYRGFIHQGSIVEHNIGGHPSVRYSSYRVGVLAFPMMELPPIRCYYHTRNLMYFWVHEYRVRNFYTLSFLFLKICKVLMSFIFRPVARWQELSACLRGIWNGLFKNMHRRY